MVRYNLLLTLIEKSPSKTGQEFEWMKEEVIEHKKIDKNHNESKNSQNNNDESKDEVKADVSFDIVLDQSYEHSVNNLNQKEKGIFILIQWIKL